MPESDTDRADSCRRLSVDNGAVNRAGISRRARVSLETRARNCANLYKMSRARALAAATPTDDPKSGARQLLRAAGFSASVAQHSSADSAPIQTTNRSEKKEKVTKNEHSTQEKLFP